MIKVLFVCMGNICRSPTAQGVFEHLVEKHQLIDDIEVDSAGTHAYHVGSAPDKRSQQAALKRGYNIAHQRARVIESKDFKEFDYILVMDNENLENVSKLCPPNLLPKVSLFLDFADNVSKKEVPDPYYTTDGFDEVVDLIEAASLGLMADIKTKL